MLVMWSYFAKNFFEHEFGVWTRAPLKISMQWLMPQRYEVGEMKLLLISSMINSLFSSFLDVQQETALSQWTVSDGDLRFHLWLLKQSENFLYQLNAWFYCSVNTWGNSKSIQVCMEKNTDWLWGSARKTIAGWLRDIDPRDTPSEHTN